MVLQEARIMTRTLERPEEEAVEVVEGAEAAEVLAEAPVRAASKARDKVRDKARAVVRGKGKVVVRGKVAGSKEAIDNKY